MNEAKQKAIEAAYGEYWGDVKCMTDDYGWSGIYYEKIGVNIFGSEAEYKSFGKWRPISLKGIENNNGWIRIESEDDLPKDGVHYAILLDDKCYAGYRNYDILESYKLITKYNKKEISHYQPLTKPFPPIY